jgi:hypothetical protein
MSTINFGSLKKLVAGTTLAVAIAAALSFAHNESIARDVGTSKATYQGANLGDSLPVSLGGGGIAPILW